MEFEKLKDAISSVEPVQKAARDLMLAQASFAESFTDWADSQPEGSSIKGTLQSMQPLFTSLTEAQCEYIAMLRSFVYYEMSQLQAITHDQLIAQKARELATANLQRKSDAVAKLQEKGGDPTKTAKAEAMKSKAKEDLAKAQRTEATAIFTRDYSQVRIFKQAFKVLSSSGERLAQQERIVWDALYKSVDAIPEPEPGQGSMVMDNGVPVPVPECGQAITEAQDSLQEVQPKFYCRYPGVFFHKKAEKVGREKKRFFQLEPPDEAVEGSRLGYYVDIKDGVGIEKKGIVQLDATTEMKTEGPTIYIKTGARTWQLIAKNDREAVFWKKLFDVGRTGITEAYLYQPMRAPIPNEEILTRLAGEAAKGASIYIDSESAGATLSMNDDSDIKKGMTKNPLASAPQERPASTMAMSYVVLEDYVSPEGEGTLNVRVGESVEIQEKGAEGWWYAFISDENQGWIPADCCQDPSSASAPEAAPIPEEEPKQADTNTTMPAAGSGDMHKMLEDYKSLEGEGTLDLKAGDVVDIQEKGDGWWFGVAPDGTEGWLPATLVESASGGAGGAAEPQPADGEAELPLMLFTALYDNEGKADGELTFKEGDVIVQVKGEDENGWAYGYIQGEDDVVGAFPANYVEARDS